MSNIQGLLCNVLKENKYSVIFPRENMIDEMLPEFWRFLVNLHNRKSNVKDAFFFCVNFYIIFNNPKFHHKTYTFLKLWLAAQTKIPSVDCPSF